MLYQKLRILNSRGYTLIEVLISMVVLSAGSILAYQVYASILDSGYEEIRRVHAEQVAISYLEDARHQSQTDLTFIDSVYSASGVTKDWDKDTNTGDATFDSSGLSDLPDVVLNSVTYKTVLSYKVLDSDLLRIRVETSYQGAQGYTKSVVLESITTQR